MADFYVQKGHGGTNSGTAANPYLTIQAGVNAAQSAGSGDHNVYVKKPVSGDYTELVTMTTAGSGGVIAVIGYEVTINEVPPKKINITGGGSNNYGFYSTFSGTSNWAIRNFKITGSTGGGILMVTANRMSVGNIESSNNAGGGINVGQQCALTQAICANNGGWGVSMGAIGVGFNVICYGNTGGNYQQNSSGALASYLGYALPANTQNVKSGGSSFMLVSATLDGESGALTNGYLGSSVPNIVANCIVRGHTSGIENPTGACRVTALYNLMHNNTTNFTRAVEFSNTNIVGDPKFTNLAGDNYTLAGDSPAINAGGDASDVAT